MHVLTGLRNGYVLPSFGLLFELWETNCPDVYKCHSMVCVIICSLHSIHATFLTKWLQIMKSLQSTAMWNENSSMSNRRHVYISLKCLVHFELVRPLSLSFLLLSSALALFLAPPTKTWPATHVHTSHIYENSSSLFAHFEFQVQFSQWIVDNSIVFWSMCTKIHFVLSIEHFVFSGADNVTFCIVSHCCSYIHCHWQWFPLFSLLFITLFYEFYSTLSFLYDSRHIQFPLDTFFI